MSNHDTIKFEQDNYTIIDNSIFEIAHEKSAFILYCVLRKFRNNTSGRAFPSYSTINRMTGMGKATIKRSLDKLVELELISKIYDEKIASNCWLVKTKYTQNDTSAKMEHTQNGTPPTPKMELGVDPKRNTNYTKLTTLNISTLDKGAKALTPQITQSDIILNEPKITKLDILKSELSSLEDYPKQDRLDFYAYWTEVDSFAKKKVMRFEKAKPFNVKRRLATWMSKKADWQNPVQAKTERDAMKIKATMGMTLHQKVQWEYDNKFITREQLESMNIKGIDL